MQKINISPIILCGGSGSRLWPLSRKRHPKQFLQLLGDKSLFQESIERAISLKDQNININEIIIITNEDHRFLALHQIEKYKKKIAFRIILEPKLKNTAPALTLSALASYSKNPESILLVMPSDHHFGNKKNFKKVLQSSIKASSKENIIILGIKPNSNSSNFGYIKYEGKGLVKNVNKFVEKPSEKIAEKMIQDGKCAWNAGFFILNSSTWIESIKKCNKKIFNYVKKSWDKHTVDEWFLRPNAYYFSKSPSDSIDYSVIEKKELINAQIKLILLDSKWSDLGSFESLGETKLRKINNNYLHGDILTIDSNKNIVISTKKNISLIGVENSIIIETADSVLVAARDKINLIKEMVKKVEKKQPSLLLEHTKVNRPWGWFEILDEGANYKVKRIVVKPNSKLSYQAHKYRSEHWVVLKGKASILRDKEEIVLLNNESTFIKKGMRHQLKNNQKIDLEIIEVQTGNKISEEDIIRYDDEYGRI